MNNSDEVEFWLGGNILTSVRSSMQPNIDDIVNIQGKNYRVTSRNFAVDYVDNFALRRIRLAMNIKLIK